MRTEQKIFNDLIETIVNNSENNEAKITNVELWAKSWKEEMKQSLTLTDVGFTLPRPLEAWNEAQKLDVADYIDWHLEKEKSGN
jgi:hypothetical protein